MEHFHYFPFSLFSVRRFVSYIHILWSRERNSALAFCRMLFTFALALNVSHMLSVHWIVCLYLYVRIHNKQYMPMSARAEELPTYHFDWWIIQNCSTTTTTTKKHRHVQRQNHAIKTTTTTEYTWLATAIEVKVLNNITSFQYAKLFVRCIHCQ